MDKFTKSTIPLKILRDASGASFSPVTSEESVIDENGTTLKTKLDTISSTKANLDYVNTELGKKSNTSHNHNSVYLGKTENATSATKLATARTINGVSFDGTSNITITDSTKVSPTGTIVANRIPIFTDTTGKVIKDSGFTIATSVPSNAKFTDTVYTHPNDANTRHVTDTEKSNWNSKASGNHNHDSIYEKIVDNWKTGIKLLEPNQDLDKLYDSAIYASDSDSNSTTILNRPPGTRGFILQVYGVYGSGAGGRQIQVAYMRIDKRIYMRDKSENSAWSAWTLMNENSWRGVQDNLTSTATDQSLSANQGKVLKGLIDGKANASHGTHVTYATSAPQANGTASAGTTNDVARGNHVHPLQTSVSGNAGTATKLATARTITLNGVVSGSTSFDGSGNVTITTSANDITTITKSLKVTTAWMDTGIAGANLSTGTFAVQMFVNDGTNTSQYNEYYSGIMSWYNGGTNSSASDEILLHKAGQASNDRHIYLRTLRTPSGGYLKLQISSTNDFVSATNITFKFKRLI